jgi:hypothetical protein
MMYSFVPDIGSTGNARQEMGRQPRGPVAQGLVDRLGLKKGDELTIVAAKSGTMEVEIGKAQRQRALDDIGKCGWTLPEAYKFDPDEANER